MGQCATRILPVTFCSKTFWYHGLTKALKEHSPSASCGVYSNEHHLGASLASKASGWTVEKCCTYPRLKTFALYFAKDYYKVALRR